MSRLDKYQSALLVANADNSDSDLCQLLDEGGMTFVSFIVDHGLGPLWHERTKREEFRDSRMAAEANFLLQERALGEIETILADSDIEYAVIKGGATRLRLYENPAVRACHDIDLVVSSEDRVRAVTVLMDHGFVASPDASIIGHELLLSRSNVDVDLHWGLLRDGRLRSDCVAGMLSRRERSNNIWMLASEDALFVLLVHPAIAKHLERREMGLHRVVDIIEWIRTQDFDWQVVIRRLEQNGVRTAAWATLRWTQMLSGSTAPAKLESMLADIKPGRIRRAWVDFWLRKDLSTRTSGMRWVRLLGFSLLLHDKPKDAVRALTGRYRAYRRQADDLAVFSSSDIE
jgi:hypothetical protein